MAINPLLSQALRAKADVQTARSQGLGYQNLANQANPTFTVGGQNGGPVGIDWGAALQSGFGNYMAQKKAKEASQKEMEATDLNQQFMQDTLKDDPESQRLFQMVQAGVPGADQALSERIAPKKQSVAVFTQYVSQNPELDDASAIALGQQSGLSPELSIGLARSARASLEKERSYKEQQGLEQYGRQVALQDRMLNSKFQYGSALRQIPQARILGGPNGNANMPQLTPGEKQLRGKALLDFDNQLQGMDASLGVIHEARAAVDRDNTFGPASKVSEFLSNSNSPVLSSLGKMAQTEGQTLLQKVGTDTMLVRMGQLGGPDSDEDRRQMMKDLPTAMNSKEMATKMLDNLERWQATTRLALQMRRNDMASGKFFDGSPASMNRYYQEAKRIVSQGGVQAAQNWQPPATPQAPVQQPGNAPLRIQIEQEADEFGFQ